MLFETILTGENEKHKVKNLASPRNVLHDKDLQKWLRLYRDGKLELKHYKDGSADSIESGKLKSVVLKMHLAAEKKAVANKYFKGNTHALRMTDLRQETQEMEELLQKTTDDRLVKIRGKQVPLKDFALRQAFGMSLCSTKAIYQYNQRTEKYKFKHALRCGRRTCSVCAHFDGIEDGRLILNELQNKILGLSAEQKKNGRLYHIVLTHENVPLDRVFDICKAWRHTQMSKKKVYKTKENPYDIWNIMQWGLWRWEITRNAETGLYHPHLHIVAYVQGWLAPERGGYWDRLVQSWIAACANVGVEANWAAQHMGLIMYFKDGYTADPRALGYEFTVEDLNEVVEGAVAEMAKYAVKSTDFTKLQRVKDGTDVTELANEMAYLFALMSGRKLLSGFGGFKLRVREEEEVVEQEVVEEEKQIEEPDDLMEVIFVWDRRERRYIMQTIRKWSQERYDDYITDMACYKDRHTLMMHYGLERDTAA